MPAPPTSPAPAPDAPAPAAGWPRDRRGSSPVRCMPSRRSLPRHLDDRPATGGPAEILLGDPHENVTDREPLEDRAGDLVRPRLEQVVALALHPLTPRTVEHVVVHRVASLSLD